MALDLALDLTHRPAVQGAASVAGLTEGSIVLTLAGEMPVEHLMPGDRVISRNAGTATLRAVEVTEAPVAVVRIKAGSLGHNRPDTDTALAPGAMVHIRDWRAGAMFGGPSAMVAPDRLIDGEFVTGSDVAPRRVFTLVFDRPQILYVDGLEVGSAV